MKHLLIFLLLALGGFALPVAAGNNEGVRSVSLHGQSDSLAVAEIAPQPAKTGPAQIRSREPGSRPKLAPIVREFAPPAPKMGPALRQFKTTALV